MLRFAKIFQKPHLLTRFTGLTPEEFTSLATRLKPIWEQSEKERLSQRERKHALGQGRKYKLTALEDKLLLVLISHRFQLTDELMGYIFGLHASNVCRMRIKLEPIMEKVMDSSLQQAIKSGISLNKKKISKWEDLHAICPDFAEIIADGQKQKLMESI
ncbi:MAG: transposase family protein [wastewater metagenome]|nr:transposase family protein [Candidatus Loosdrechtia aerotolerans]